MAKKKWTPEYVRYLQALARDTTSLNAPVHDEKDDAMTGEVGDYIIDDSPGPEDIAITKDRRRVLSEMIKRLSPREQMVIRMRYGLDTGTRLTLEETGDYFGVTRERIRQIEAKALRKMKAYFKRVNIKGSDI